MSRKTLINVIMRIYKVNQTGRDSIGGETQQETLLYDNVPARLTMLKASERDLVGREGVVSTHKIYCQADLSFGEKDIIKIGEGSAVQTYDISYIYNVDNSDNQLEVFVTLRE